MQETSLLRVGKWQDNSSTSEGEIRVILEPVSQENAYLFGLLWSRESREDLRQIGQLLAKLLAEAAHDDGTHHVQLRFEQLMGEINETFARQSQQPDWDLSPKDFHACIGLVEESRFFLTGTGDIRALFLRGQEDGRFQIYNLLRGLSTEQPKVTWEKIFPALLDGDVRMGDAFCVFPDDPGFPNFTNDEIHTIIATLPPQGICARLRQGFPEERAYGFFAFRSDGMDSAPATLDSGQSLSLLQQRQQLTERWMAEATSGLVVRLTSLLKQGREILKTLLPRTQHLLRGATLKRMGRRTAGGASLLSFGTKDGASRLLSTLGRLFQKIPPRQRLRVLGGIGGLLIVAASVAGLLVWNGHRNRDRAFAEEVIVIERIQTRAELALSQNNTAQAHTLLEQSLAAAASLAPRTEDHLTEQARIQQTLEAFGMRLRKEQSPSPRMILPDLASQTEGSLGAGFVKRGSEYLLLTQNGRLWNIATSGGRVTLLAPEQSSKPLTLPLSASVNGETLFVLDARPGISFSSGDTFTEGPLLSSDAPPTALTTYADRIYVLLGIPTGIGGIFRADVSDSAVGALSPWLTETVPTDARAVAITVDANVYVLSENGRVTKLSRGRPVAWNVETLDPPLTSGVALWTNASGRFLYLLDPEIGRLVVIEKEEGQLVSQYLAKEMKGALGMVVEETEKQAWIMTGETLFTIPLTHL